MAEQKSEDTRNPTAPRRGARPFVGPAGAPGSRSAPLRPPVAGVRPARGPFVPASPPPRRALGAPAPEAPVDPAAVASRLTPPIPTAAIQTTALPATPPTEPAADATAWWTADDVVEAPTTSSEPGLPELDADATAAEVSTTDASSSDAASSERFAAFDAEWHDVEVPDAAVPSDPAPPALDVDTLGSATGNEQMWAEDIAAEASAAPTADVNMPPWLLDDLEPASSLETPVVASSGEASVEFVPEASTAAPTADSGVETTGPSVDGTWTDDVILPSAESLVTTDSARLDAEPATPSVSIPAGEMSALEVPSLEAAESETAASKIPPTDTWPDQLLAEYAPYVPTPVVPSLTGEDQTDRHSPMEAVGDEPAQPAEIDELDVKPEGPGVRVSAALNRLADRIRDGEIDVSTIAPEASDAAVLASLLAALLGGGGGGSSSSR